MTAGSHRRIQFSDPGFLASTAELAAVSEDIRLVIWDLDETFWHGTLTEGGIRYRQDVHAIVVELARRGIVSSICSKNDLDAARSVLQRRGLWSFFVFPSLDWSPKGPRLRELVKQFQLRPETVLFIDDNPLNRAEALYFVPGLQVASEQVIPSLLGDARLKGKDDSDLSRLGQYHLLQTRKTASAGAGDAIAFLRESRITVHIEHDIGLHADRVIELINRTNQLNFVKQRLPEDPAEARAALQKLVSPYVVQAGLVGVQDRYGDYGFCGFYALHNQHCHPKRLLQFCFSCRILGMGVETWLYRMLGRPLLTTEGEVLTDVVSDTREIDWIEARTAEHSGSRQKAGQRDYVLARGGCDINALAHYLGLAAKRLVGELHVARHGMIPAISHSIMLRHALKGIAPEAVRDAGEVGFAAEDFRSLIADVPRDETGVWLLSFTHDTYATLYRHKSTGALIPFHCVPDDVVKRLQPVFEFVGEIPDAIFIENLTMILQRAAPRVRVFILLGNELGRGADGVAGPHSVMIHRNRLVREVVSDFPCAEAIDVSAFFEPGTQVVGDHFDRMVYFRVYQHVMARLAE